MERTFLHVGCGSASRKNTTRGFVVDPWREVRLDINPDAKPDVIGTMTNMVGVADESVDAVFSSHNIEHLNAHEVPVALREFARVLKADGFVVLTCPDLQSVCRLVAEEKLLEPAYISNAGPIAPLDILYGHRPALAQGNSFMAHRCGFTKSVLQGVLAAGGFVQTMVMQREAPHFDLWAIALKKPLQEQELRSLVDLHFPQEQRATIFVGG